MQRELKETTDYLKSRLTELPQIAVVLGSGLGPLADQIKNPVYIPYGEIPHFKTSTAPDHIGRFVCGELGGKLILCMQGRLHGYEGYTPQEIAYPIFTLKALGIKKLLLTNASGGINQSFAVGDFMLIEDHINFTGKSPLTGKNDTLFGPRFPDMTFAYSKEMQMTAFAAAAECGITLQKGVYIGVNGPQFETPAEIRMFRNMGADAVGMSTVWEAIAAAYCGIELGAIAMITNMAAGVLMKPLSGQEVNAIAAERGTVFQMLVTAMLAKL